MVATEVRTLAQGSSEAAREISTLISTSVNQVNEGVQLVDQTGPALEKIRQAVEQISSRISTIAASAKEQSSALGEINTAVNSLDGVTQQNAAMFEETTAASHALTSDAEAPAKTVSHFKLDNIHHASPSKEPRKPSVAGAIRKAPRAPSLAGNVALKTEDAAPQQGGWEDF
ncbi:methyl-accepting chemotaxis protein [Roseobacter sinensis]|uniref:methyl-accepting chemotaxis protein n=1 Tax=Roseobacter sinensis TaxID=2931391 RepID=UPI0021E748E5|nr:methyl-accepting chemotaxis protein [Roseobacter sp. WL0113]